MAGKDVVNMIKATMEWVDIPIVLYTRAAIANQKDARITTAPTSSWSRGRRQRRPWWPRSSPFPPG